MMLLLSVNDVLVKGSIEYVALTEEHILILVLLLTALDGTPVMFFRDIATPM